MFLHVWLQSVFTGFTTLLQSLRLLMHSSCAHVHHVFYVMETPVLGSFLGCSRVWMGKPKHTRIWTGVPGAGNDLSQEKGREQVQKKGLNIYGQQRDSANSFPRPYNKLFHQ